MAERNAWLIEQLKRPMSRAAFGMPDNQLAYAIAGQLRSSFRLAPTPLDSPSFVAGQVSPQPPFRVDVRPYLEGEAFGPLAGRDSDSIVRPHLKGTIEPMADGSCALVFRIDQFATALATILLAALAVVLVLVGGLGHFLGGADWKMLGSVLALIGVIIGVWPLMFLTRIGAMKRYEEHLMQWVTDLGGTYF